MSRRLDVVGLCALLGWSGLFGCSKKEPETRPVEQTAAPVAASAKAVVAGKKRFTVKETGRVAVMIEAPLEKFKGETKKLSGVFDVDLADLANSTGEVIADLDGFVTSTFTDPDKNESQTEHAKNWFQIGEKVENAERDDFRMARFTIEKVEKSSVKTLGEAKDEAGARTVHLTARGTLRVHGRPSPKTIEVDVTFQGPADAPSAMTFKTTAPLLASLSEHDVKPRDVTGKFLAGALEKVGKKMDDRARITVEGSAAPKG